MAAPSIASTYCPAWGQCMHVRGYAMLTTARPGPKTIRSAYLAHRPDPALKPASLPRNNRWRACRVRAGEDYQRPKAPLHCTSRAQGPYPMR